MSARLVVLAAMLVAACALESNWMLAESGYSIDVAAYGEEFAFRVHVNELKQRGGDIKSPQFHLFVADRLKRHGVCLADWEELLCADPALCVYRTRTSVTVYGRCLAP